MLDREHATKIAEKLKAEINEKRNRPHDLAVIKYNGKWIAAFGISHSSKKSEPHDHIPKSLKCSPHFCLELATCSKYLDDWVQLMREKGMIEN